VSLIEAQVKSRLRSSVSVTGAQEETLARRERGQSLGTCHTDGGRYDLSLREKCGGGVLENQASLPKGRCSLARGLEPCKGSSDLLKGSAAQTVRRTI